VTLGGLSNLWDVMSETGFSVATAFLAREMYPRSWCKSQQSLACFTIINLAFVLDTFD